MVTQTSSEVFEGVIVTPLEIHTDQRGWLTELYRQDELAPEHLPAMAYASLTLPGVARGPHEHRHQTDCFLFFGPGDLKLYLWDSRHDLHTFGERRTIVVGERNRARVIVPPGVVHAYLNIGDAPALVVNCPDQLYRGTNRAQFVDEIRHEAHTSSRYILD